MNSAHHDLELEQDDAFQRRDWLAQRIAWIMYAVILLAAIAGVFGSGPLSWQTVSDREQRISLHFQRVHRREAPQTLTIRARPSDPKSKSLRVWLDKEYVRDLHIEGITPEPESSELRDDRVVLTFNLAPGQNEVMLKVDCRARDFGRLHGRAGLDEGPTLHFTQFIFP